ncbi:tRNA pseudouridine(38-40) synthase TruA [Desulfuribacillus alkaliarsenatis]|uniref:tRNA pseudouridine synthase A n=1 Tax=Desulfuribacillus alkaliarsenatis TaxID=766136 RepID=A0A1E5G483_9FIRM|nr:tRNA pseudouridine(38-40) synthase TruA [Desulfuribacillus alkaliarsenatis]OEF97906.1 tRNA pseudouridine(38-40) synthase TruA [Desulfuribacillus alkaliarsenatis]
MQRIRLIFSYEGTDFYGYQIQPNGRTVQAELDKALTAVFNTEVRTTASGRTDRGVHAIHQVAHFDVQTTVPLEKMVKVINSKLPNDIVAHLVETVASDFHARYNVKEKTYCYMIDNHQTANIFNKRFSNHVEKKLNTRRMREAAEYLVGTHDFTSFCSHKSDVEDKVRTIYTIDIRSTKGLIKIFVTGNGFLYNMVRIIAGALIEVGKGRLAPDDLKDMLSAKDRTRCPITAPAHGLTLWNVKY